MSTPTPATLKARRIVVARLIRETGHTCEYVGDLLRVGGLFEPLMVEIADDGLTPVREIAEAVLRKVAASERIQIRAVA